MWNIWLHALPAQTENQIWWSVAGELRSVTFGRYKGKKKKKDKKNLRTFKILTHHVPLLGVFQVHCNIFLYSTFQIISLEQSKCYRDKGSVQVEPFDVITSTFHQRNKIFVSNGNAVPTVLADRFFSQWN